MEKPKNITQNLKIQIDPNKTPILYSDIVYIKSSVNGIVLDFAQQIGPSDEFNVVSRIGISKDHAQKLVEHLEAILRVGGTSITKKTN